MDHTELVEDHEQHLTLKFKDYPTDTGTFITSM